MLILYYYDIVAVFISPFPSQSILDLKEKHSRNDVANTKLFTLSLRELNWFMWGDIFFIISSIMFLLQPFFLVYLDGTRYYTQTRDRKYYFFSK